MYYIQTNWKKREKKQDMRTAVPLEVNQTVKRLSIKHHKENAKCFPKDLILLGLLFCFLDIPRAVSLQLTICYTLLISNSTLKNQGHFVAD